MFCPSCGNQIPDDSKFCKHCGKPVSASPPSQPVTASFKDFIGKSLEDPALQSLMQRFCRLGGFDYHCRALGIEFSLDGRNMVDCVWLYPPDTSDYVGYKGEMPYGLAWSDKRADVEKKLGLPDGPLNWGWQYKRLGITITYNEPSDRSSSMQQILLSTR